MNIDEDSGIITTSVSNAFDYERQTEMIVQVSATDTLVDEYGTRHTTFAQLRIEVLDVNDETPRITVVRIYCTTFVLPTSNCSVSDFSFSNSATFWNICNLQSVYFVSTSTLFLIELSFVEFLIKLMTVV